MAAWEIHGEPRVPRQVGQNFYGYVEEQKLALNKWPKEGAKTKGLPWSRISYQEENLTEMLDPKEAPVERPLQRQCQEEDCMRKPSYF